MEKYILTAKEFLYLCASVDVYEIYGVENAFKGMNAAQIEQQIPVIQQSLENKGYIESDFDGNSYVNQNLLELVEKCATCQKMITVDKRKTGEETKAVVFYAKDGEIIKSDRIDDGYEVSLVKKSEVLDFVSDILSKVNSENNYDFEKFSIPNKILTKAKTKASSGYYEDAEKAVKEIVSDKKLAKAIIDGITEKCGFYSVVTTDFTVKEDFVKNTSFIDTNCGLITVTPTVNGIVSEVEFESACAEKIKETVIDNLSALL